MSFARELVVVNKSPKITFEVRLLQKFVQFQLDFNLVHAIIRTTFLNMEANLKSFVTRLFIFQLQCVRPLSYCAPIIRTSFFSDQFLSVSLQGTNWTHGLIEDTLHDCGLI